MISTTSTAAARAQQRPAFTARELTVTAVMTALVFLATFVPRIPIPLGYAHLGDAVIFLLALSIGRREALIAACLGSALSDVLGGFLLWAVPTLVIKFFMADIVWRIAGRGNAGRLRVLGAFVLSSVWMASPGAAMPAVCACWVRSSFPPSGWRRLIRCSALRSMRAWPLASPRRRAF